MHQSGHSRAHSMHTVQFSSLSAITPRVLNGRSCFSSGYSITVLCLKRCFSVTASPFRSPKPKPRRRALFRRGSIALPFGSSSVSTLLSSSIAMSSSLNVKNPCTGREDEREGRRDQVLPGKLLKLVLTYARKRRSDPQEQENHEHHLDREPDHARNDFEWLPRNYRFVAAEEEGRCDTTERDHVAHLGEHVR